MDRGELRLACDALSLHDPARCERIYQGDWAAVYRLETVGGETCAVKCPSPGYEHLARAEADMLRYLAETRTAPVPAVVGLHGDMLFLEYVAHDGQRSDRAQAEAGAALARLHGVSSESFGFDHDTIFGPTAQPNASCGDWVQFFGERRLLHMAAMAHGSGQISGRTVERVEQLASRLDDWLPQRPEPALVHGDFWGGNVLFRDGHCAAFIDPAIYFGHAEVDLAFATLFGSFSQPFFDGYRAVRAVEPGFRERIGIYNLWPLLFHAWWFGGGYARQVDSILGNYGV